LKKGGDKEMKKLIAVTLAVVLVISAIAAIPVLAKTQPPGGRAVFESDIVPTFNAELQGLTLEKGEVWIRADGSFKVEIEGVNDVEGTTYDVYLRHGVGRGEANEWLGVLVLDEDGEDILEGNLSSVFGDDMTIRSPMIRIYDQSGGWKAEFASGFYYELPE